SQDREATGRSHKPRPRTTRDGPGTDDHGRLRRRRLVHRRGSRLQYRQDVLGLGDEDLRELLRVLPAPPLGFDQGRQVQVGLVALALAALLVDLAVGRFVASWVGTAHGRSLRRSGHGVSPQGSCRVWRTGAVPSLHKETARAAMRLRAVGAHRRRTRDQLRSPARSRVALFAITSPLRIASASSALTCSRVTRLCPTSAPAERTVSPVALLAITLPARTASASSARTWSRDLLCAATGLANTPSPVALLTKPWSAAAAVPADTANARAKMEDAALRVMTSFLSNEVQ